MEEKKEKSSGHLIGHSVRTYRVRLYDRHFSWLKATKELYHQVVLHFFRVLSLEQKRQESWKATGSMVDGLEFHQLAKEDELQLMPGLKKQSNFVLLRLLETKCIGTREMKAKGQEPEYPLSVEGAAKIPLYFRRSAINTAIDLFKKGAAGVETLDSNMVLYKGMYRNFTEGSIELKLFNGEKWVWVRYPFANVGRKFPEEGEKLSPLLVLKKKEAWLEVPLSFEVKDIRTVKERMQTEEKICAVAFPDNDTLAVAVILDRTGKELESRFFHGGKQKEHLRRQILERIRKSEESRGNGNMANGSGNHTNSREEELDKEDSINLNCSVSPVSYKENMGNTAEKSKKDDAVRENGTLYEELRNLNQYYAHKISKQVLEYCLEKEIKVIVVPKYEDGINFAEMRYLKTDSYRWLGRSMIQKLKYKAFAEGIVVTSVRPYHSAEKCSECGELIKRYNEGHIAGKKYYGGKLFVCPNGHKGNTAENAAKNLGRSFLKYFNG